MKWEMADSMLKLSVDGITALAIAALLLLIGYWVKKKVGFLERFCIPAPVVGGFLLMLVNFVLHLTGVASIEFDTMYQAPFMLAFFTTVGLGASFSLLKKGGILLVIYWLVCGTVSIIQNSIGIGVAKLTGLAEPYALISSAISMLGGHGAAAAYGGTFETMGYANATLVGMAAATFGLISGVIVGGPVGRRLIVRYNLKPEENQTAAGGGALDKINATPERAELSFSVIMRNVTSILVCMAVGTMIAGGVSKLINMEFPTYVGAMFVAVIMRNVNEKLHFYEFNYPMMEKVGDVMLNLYLSLALMSLKLWELADLALPVLLVLMTQVLVLVLLCYFVVFRVLGKNYDAAVMCAGLMGHGLGATPSAIVNMSAINEKYGTSYRAMMIVPIVGAFLVDIIYQPVTIWFIKTFVQNIA